MDSPVDTGPVVEISADELKRLRSIEAKWRRLFCTRCDKLSVVAVGQTCNETPCPMKQYLTPAQIAQAQLPGFVRAPRKLPILPPPPEKAST